MTCYLQVNLHYFVQVVDLFDFLKYFEELMLDLYNKKSKKFVDRLYNFGIAKTVISSIKGEPSPIIPHPNDESWNGLSLPWMTYGYGVKMTPMQGKFLFKLPNP